MNAPASPLPLAVEGLGYSSLGRTLLGPLGFTLEAGRRHVVIGPNGAGKSLLLRLLHGLLRPTAGTIRWAADDPALIRGAQAFVFQKPVMLRRSVRADLELALAARGVPPAERAQRITEALNAVGLPHVLHRQARVLSGGEQQRVALARAWALRPRLLFLDEPTASLDPGAVRAIETAVMALHRQGVTIVMTTHDLGQAKRLADRVLFLHRGRLLEDQHADVFFREPRSVEARRFLAGELLD